MENKKIPPRRDEKIEYEWWEKRPWLLYVPSIVMSIAALIISIVQLLR